MKEHDILKAETERIYKELVASNSDVFDLFAISLNLLETANNIAENMKPATRGLLTGLLRDFFKDKGFIQRIIKSYTIR